MTKPYNFISILNDNFYEDSFEVYYKLVILEFSSKIFFILTSITSETSWGQTMSLTDLTEVSKCSWRCQLPYETLFVGLVLKLKPSETTVSHRVILDPPPLPTKKPASFRVNQDLQHVFKILLHIKIIELWKYSLGFKLS